MLGLGDAAWSELITDYVVVAGLTGYATVRAGSLFAPSSKKVVPLVVGGGTAVRPHIFHGAD